MSSFEEAIAAAIAKLNSNLTAVTNMASNNEVVVNWTNTIGEFA
jgi:hypothetical protein